MKPTSRLLLRVLGEEAKKESPFSSPLDPKALLVDIHCESWALSVSVWMLLLTTIHPKCIE